MLSQTEMAGMQEEQEKLKVESPVPVDRLRLLEEALAQQSAAMEKQIHQLSVTQQVSWLFANCK